MYEEKDTTKKAKNKKNKSEKFFYKESKIKKLQDTISEKIDEKKSNSSSKVLSIKADWVSILIKFAILLVILFIVIFVITKIRQSSANKSFTENMETMKEVAYTYFKDEDNRPTLVDWETRVTLGDMIDSNLITELKDEDGNVCSYNYSYVSLVKNSDTEYEMYVYLTCGGEGKSATYSVIYANTIESESSTETETTNTTVDSSTSETITLYELKREVEVTTGYSCPDGYLNSGRYCISVDNTITIDATPIYKVTPEKNTAAKYKSSGVSYEYADAIVTVVEDSLTCPSGYTLEGDTCIKESTVKYKTTYEYTCPDGGTPSGTKCLFTTSTNYTNRKAYCSTGTLVNGNKCYVTKDYSLKCITGKKDSSRNECYTTYKASKELSDWLYDGKVTYSESKDVSKLETEKVKYEFYSQDEDTGKITYRKYIRKYVYVCDDDDELSGSTCKHYDEAYEQRYCSSGYSLTSDESECYKYTTAKYKSTSGTYTCPTGYKKSGSGDSAYCYKYESATKTENKEVYCTSGYDLTSDGRCVKTTTPTSSTEVTYSCPDGYTQKGSGSSTKCYKITTTDAYYYCTNSEATLEGDRCIVSSVTTFVGYKCPSGYTLSGDECVKTNAKVTILAEEVTTTITSSETIWSKSKNVSGWTWTGNTQEV